MTFYGCIIMDSCIISFNFNCIMQLKQFWNTFTKVSSTKKCYYFWWSPWLYMLLKHMSLWVMYNSCFIFKTKSQSMESKSHFRFCSNWSQLLAGCRNHMNSQLHQMITMNHQIVGILHCHFILTQPRWSTTQLPRVVSIRWIMRVKVWGPL